jgi:cytidylate kinase
MSVITISRGTMSGGKLIAEGLAASLGFRCIDRDVIVEKAAASGVSHEELRDALDKPPTFLERFQHRKYLYLALIQAALTEEVKTGKAIYQGNAGHLLLKGGGPVFRVRIIAPMDFRIAMARKRLKFGEDEAIHYIQKMDEDRRKWTQYLYGVDWTDPSLYDLIVNLEYVDAQDAVDGIAHIVRNQACFDFDARCEAMMQDLAVASRVRADLALSPALAHLEFEVTLQDGQVVIKGKLPDIKLVDEVKRIALAAPGVEEVSLSQVTAPTVA